MAANSSIGKLNVMIGASADGFIKGIEMAEKRMAGFRAKAFSLPNAIIGGFSGISGNIEKGINDAIKMVGSTASVFAGGGDWAKKMGLKDFDKWNESAERGVDTIKELNRISKFHGVSTQFAQTMKMMAGGDSDAAIMVIDRIAAAQSKVAAGDKSVTEGLSPFLDIQKFADGSVEEGVRQVSSALKELGSQKDKMGLATELAGKKGAGRLMEALGAGPGRMDQIFALLEREAATIDESTVATQKYIAAVLKLKEAAEQAALDLNRSSKKQAIDMLYMKYEEGEIGMGDFLSARLNIAMNGRDVAMGYLKSWESQRKHKLGDLGTQGHGMEANYKDEQAIEEAKRLMDMQRKADEQMAKAYEQELATGMTAEERWKAEQERVAKLVGDRSKRTPEELARIDRALGSSFATIFGVNQAIASAKQQFALQSEASLPRLALAGSQEAFAAIDKAFNPTGDKEPDVKTLVDLTKQELEKTRRAEEQRDKIINALTGQQTIVVNVGG